MQDENLVGRCDLYCGACTTHRAYKDAGEYPTRVANYFKCPPERSRAKDASTNTGQLGLR